MWVRHFPQIFFFLLFQKRTFGYKWHGLSQAVTQQCQSTEGNTKHWREPVAWLHPFLIYHRTPGGRGIADFMPAPMPILVQKRQPLKINEEGFLTGRTQAIQYSSVNNFTQPIALQLLSSPYHFSFQPSRISHKLVSANLNLDLMWILTLMLTLTPTNPMLQHDWSVSSHLMLLDGYNYLPSYSSENNLQSCSSVNNCTRPVTSSGCRPTNHVACGQTVFLSPN